MGCRGERVAARVGWLVVFFVVVCPAAPVLVGDRFPLPTRQRTARNDFPVLSRDPRRRRRAQMRSAIREVELVDELLTTGQRGQPGGGTINDSLIDVIEFGLPYPPAVGDHEPIQLRAISTSERAIDRISKRALTL